MDAAGGHVDEDETHDDRSALSTDAEIFGNVQAYILDILSSQKGSAKA